MPDQEEKRGSSRCTGPIEPERLEQGVTTLSHASRRRRNLRQPVPMEKEREGQIWQCGNVSSAVTLGLVESPVEQAPEKNAGCPGTRRHSFLEGKQLQLDLDILCSSGTTLIASSFALLFPRSQGSTAQHLRCTFLESSQVTATFLPSASKLEDSHFFLLQRKCTHDSVFLCLKPRPGV